MVQYVRIVEGPSCFERILTALFVLGGIALVIKGLVKLGLIVLGIWVCFKVFVIVLSHFFLGPDVARESATEAADNDDDQDADSEDS